MLVFTTAYSEYGVESYEYDAIDYLLKPIKYERFLKAVGKVYERNNGARQTVQPELKNQNNQMIIRSGTQVHRILLDQLYFIEGAGNYVNFYVCDKKIMVLQTMKETIAQLPAEQFARVHKSYVVAMRYIDVVERHQITIKNHKIPIGITYREHFLNQYYKM